VGVYPAAHIARNAGNATPVGRLQDEVEQPCARLHGAMLNGWLDFERRFRNLAPQLHGCRLDLQTGAGGEHWQLVGGYNPAVRREFESLSTLAGNMLTQAVHGDQEFNQILAHNNPKIRWYHAVIDISRAAEPGLVAYQTNSAGEQEGIYQWTLNDVAQVAANVCLELHAHHRINMNPEPRRGITFKKVVTITASLATIVGTVFVVITYRADDGTGNVLPISSKNGDITIGRDVIGGNVINNYGVTDEQITNIVKREMEQSSDRYAVLAIKSNRYVVPVSQIPAGFDIDWSTGSVKQSADSFEITIPNMVVNTDRVKDVKLTRITVDLPKQIGANRKLMQVGNQAARIEVLGIDGDLVVIGIRFVDTSNEQPRGD